MPSSVAIRVASRPISSVRASPSRARAASVFAASASDDRGRRIENERWKMSGGCARRRREQGRGGGGGGESATPSDGRCDSKSLLAAGTSLLRTHRLQRLAGGRADDLYVPASSVPAAFDVGLARALHEPFSQFAAASAGMLARTRPTTVRLRRTLGKSH